jgi:hypothetical protein
MEVTRARALAALGSTAALALGGSASIRGLATVAGAHEPFPPPVVRWYVESVHKARPAIRHGHWRICGYYGYSRLVTHFACSIARSRYRTVRAEIRGDLKVAKKALNASIGYEAGQSITYTNTYTVDIPPRHWGRIEWAPSFNDRKRVLQAERKVPQGVDLDRRTVTTEKPSGPRWRVRDHHKH